MSTFGEALRVSRNKVGLPLRAAVIFALCLCCRNIGDGELLLRLMSREGSCPSDQDTAHPCRTPGRDTAGTGGTALVSHRYLPQEFVGLYGMLVLATRPLGLTRWLCETLGQVSEVSVPTSSGRRKAR